MSEKNKNSETKSVSNLISDWEQSARDKFACAARTTDEAGKRQVENGAMIYFNCAQALKAALGESLPQPSPSQQGH